MVFQDYLGGPAAFTPIDNTAKGRGRNFLFKRASEYGDVLQVTDPAANLPEVDIMGAGAANSTDGFIAVCNEKGGVADESEGAANTTGEVVLKMRRNDGNAVNFSTSLYVTEGEVWATPVADAGGSTSGRKFATLWEDVAAGGSGGDIILVRAVMQGIPPHIS